MWHEGIGHISDEEVQRAIVRAREERAKFFDALGRRLWRALRRRAERVANAVHRHRGDRSATARSNAHPYRRA